MTAQWPFINLIFPLSFRHRVKVLRKSCFIHTLGKLKNTKYKDFNIFFKVMPLLSSFALFLHKNTTLCATMNLKYFSYTYPWTENCSVQNWDTVILQLVFLLHSIPRDYTLICTLLMTSRYLLWQCEGEHPGVCFSTP